MKNRIVAKTVVVNSKGQVLLLRRSHDDPRRPGEQDFPGGQVDAGEELTVAAAREVREESGIVIDPRNLALIYAATETYTDNDMSVTRLVFVTNVDDPSVTLSDEHSEYQWCDVPTALKLFPHHVYTVALQYASERGLLQNAMYDSE